MSGGVPHPRRPDGRYTVRVRVPEVVRREAERVADETRRPVEVVLGDVVAAELRAAALRGLRCGTPSPPARPGLPPSRGRPT